MTLNPTSICFIKYLSKQMLFTIITIMFTLRMFFMKNRKRRKQWKWVEYKNYFFPNEVKFRSIMNFCHVQKCTPNLQFSLQDIFPDLIAFNSLGIKQQAGLRLILIDFSCSLQSLLLPASPHTFAKDTNEYQEPLPSPLLRVKGRTENGILSNSEQAK